MSPYRRTPLAAEQERLLIPIRHAAFVRGVATGVFLAFSVLTWAAAIVGAEQPVSRGLDIDASSYPCAVLPREPQEVIQVLWSEVTDDDGGAR